MFVRRVLLPLLLVSALACAHLCPFIAALSVKDIPQLPHHSECIGLECLSSVWCRRGANYVDIRHVWSDVEVQINFRGGEPCVITASDDSGRYQDLLMRLLNTNDTSSNQHTQTIVQKLRSQTTPDWSARVMTALGVWSRCSPDGTCSYSFSPFLMSCVKVCDNEDKPGDLHVEFTSRPRNKRPFYPLLLLSGVLVMRSAGMLSDQVAFYYLGGTSLGVVLSVFLVTYFVMKRVQPKGTSPFIAIVLAGCVQSSLGLVSFASDWLRDTAKANIFYAGVYVLTAALISLAFTHYTLSGPEGVSVSTGLRDILRWAIKLVGVAMISFSTPSTFWSVVLVLVVLLVELVAGPIYRAFRWIGANVLGLDKPAPPSKWVATPYLNREQYRIQTELNTQREIESLVASPHFKNWVVGNSERISVTPLRMTRQMRADTPDSPDW